MNATEHDTLALRLAEILLKLNQDEPFSRQVLAEEFGVSERTIYRDLNRLGGIVERLPNGLYQLVPEYRGKLQPRDLEAFAKLTGVNQLFPNNGQRFLLALLDTLMPVGLIRRFSKQARTREKSSPTTLGISASRLTWMALLLNSITLTRSTLMPLPKAARIGHRR